MRRGVRSGSMRRGVGCLFFVSLVWTVAGTHDSISEAACAKAFSCKDRPCRVMESCLSDAEKTQIFHLVVRNAEKLRAPQVSVIEEAFVSVMKPLLEKIEDEDIPLDDDEKGETMTQSFTFDSEPVSKRHFGVLFITEEPSAHGEDNAVVLRCVILDEKRTVLDKTHLPLLDMDERLAMWLQEHPLLKGLRINVEINTETTGSGGTLRVVFGMLVIIAVTCAACAIALMVSKCSKSPKVWRSGFCLLQEDPDADQHEVTTTCETRCQSSDDEKSEELIAFEID